MIFWYWYLLGVAALSLAGYITVNIYLTAGIALAAHLLFNVFPSKKRALVILEAAAVGAAALALLWRESFLPPVSTLVSFLANPKSRPTAQYMLEFFWQFLNLWMLAAGAVLFAAARAVFRKKPLALAVPAYLIFAAAWYFQPKQTVAGLDEQAAYDEKNPGEGAAATPAPLRRRGPDIAETDSFYALGNSAPPPGGTQAPAAERPSRSPAEFFKKERDKVVLFTPPAAGSRPFDVILMQICSLSWKDVKDAGASLVPFFSAFDYVFTDFNSACSYSGPVAIRLLRSPCGQAPHPRLYDPAPAGCYLFDEMRRMGFAPFTMLNTTGDYEDFAMHAEKFGRAPKALGIEGLPPAYQLFDGTNMCADDASLARVWKARLDSDAKRAFIYYNTANLHIGTHKPGVSLSPDIASSYRERLDAMLAQLRGFFAEVEKSGRNAVVIFVPEHGAAVTGSKMQAKDVRDIPLPPIAVVPAAVKLIGKDYRASGGRPQVVTRPASLQALSWLIAEFLRNDPFDNTARDPGLVAADVPGTEFLAENENAAVMRLDGGYIFRLNDGKWKPLPDYAGIPAGTIPHPEEFRKAR